MRLPVNVLSLLAGSVVGASLVACGGAAPQVPHRTTPVVMVTAPPPVTSARLPPTNGPTVTPDFDYAAAACGRG